jgi:hypothetical protein
MKGYVMLELATVMLALFVLWKFFALVYTHHQRLIFGWIPWNAKTRSSCYVYFWQDADNRRQIKIGRTNDPAKRLKTFQTAQAENIRLIAVFRCINDRAAEKMLHDRFDRERIRRNGEWFRFTPRVRLMAAVLCDDDLKYHIMKKLE